VIFLSFAGIKGETYSLKYGFAFQGKECLIRKQ
jgi:hypothetical protein